MNAEHIDSETINRALKVIKENQSWVVYIKKFDDPEGFAWSESDILTEISSAIDHDNPIHSGVSMATTLRCCQQILNFQA